MCRFNGVERCRISADRAYAKCKKSNVKVRKNKMHETRMTYAHRCTNSQTGHNEKQCRKKIECHTLTCDGMKVGVLVSPLPRPHTTPTPIHIPLKVNCAARARSHVHSFISCSPFLPFRFLFDLVLGRGIMRQSEHSNCATMSVCVCGSYRRLSIAMHLSPGAP